MAAMAAQRHLRVAALWVRLARRDNKPGYLIHGARCWRLLDESLKHPAAAPLAAFLDAILVPGNPEIRRTTHAAGWAASIGTGGGAGGGHGGGGDGGSCG